MREREIRAPKNKIKWIIIIKTNKRNGIRWSVFFWQIFDELFILFRWFISKDHSTFWLFNVNSFYGVAEKIYTPVFRHTQKKHQRKKKLME